jgi:TetR/AcrR family transcriptional regulator, fatty acid metabolism regulator protein
MRSASGMTFTEQARRQQIIDGAMRVIAEDGYAQASIARIADRISVAKSVVLYHFKTKNEIIEAVVLAVFGAAAEHMTPTVAAATSPAERLAAYIRANIAFIASNRAAAAAMLEIVTGYRSSDGRRLDQAAASSPQAARTGWSVLDPESIFTEGVHTKAFRAVSPLFMKNALRAALDGAVWESARNPAYDLTGYGEELVTVFDLATRRPT